MFYTTKVYHPTFSIQNYKLLNSIHDNYPDLSSNIKGGGAMPLSEDSIPLFSQAGILLCFQPNLLDDNKDGQEHTNDTGNRENQIDNRIEGNE